MPEEIFPAPEWTLGPQQLFKLAVMTMVDVLNLPAQVSIALMIYALSVSDFKALFTPEELDMALAETDPDGLGFVLQVLVNKFSIPP